MTKLIVPFGGAVHVSGGETCSPSWLYFGGILPPSGNAFVLRTIAGGPAAPRCPPPPPSPLPPLPCAAAFIATIPIRIIKRTFDFSIRIGTSLSCYASCLTSRGLPPWQSLPLHTHHRFPAWNPRFQRHR